MDVVVVVVASSSAAVVKQLLSHRDRIVNFIYLTMHVVIRIVTCALLQQL